MALVKVSPLNCTIIETDLLCDLYDIREMGKLCGFGKLPKDNDGTSMTIDEVLENAIELLEES